MSFQFDIDQQYNDLFKKIEDLFKSTFQNKIEDIDYFTYNFNSFLKNDNSNKELYDEILRYTDKISIDDKSINYINFLIKNEKLEFINKINIISNCKIFALLKKQSFVTPNLISLSFIEEYLNSYPNNSYQEIQTLIDNISENYSFI